MLAGAEPAWQHPWGCSRGCLNVPPQAGAKGPRPAAAARGSSGLREALSRQRRRQRTFRQPVGLIPNRLLRVRPGPGPPQLLVRIGGCRWQSGSAQAAGQAFRARGSAAVASSPSRRSGQGSSGKTGCCGESAVCTNCYLNLLQYKPSAISTFCDINLLRSQPSAISTFASASRPVFRRLAEMVPSSV
jgi:hypothetical protein